MHHSFQHPCLISLNSATKRTRRENRSEHRSKQNCPRESTKTRSPESRLFYSLHAHNPLGAQTNCPEGDKPPTHPSVAPLDQDALQHWHMVAFPSKRQSSIFLACCISCPQLQSGTSSDTISWVAEHAMLENVETLNSPGPRSAEKLWNSPQVLVTPL